MTDPRECQHKMFLIDAVNAGQGWHGGGFKCAGCGESVQNLLAEATKRAEELQDELSNHTIPTAGGWCPACYQKGFEDGQAEATQRVERAETIVSSVRSALPRECEHTGCSPWTHIERIEEILDMAEFEEANRRAEGERDECDHDRTTSRDT